MSGNDDLVRLAAQVVTAYMQSNPVAVRDLPDLTKNLPALIEQVHAKLKDLREQSSAPQASTARAVAEEPALLKGWPAQLHPAVPISESVTSDYVVCLEDGEHFSMLSRHLRAVHKMTPADYREKWNLPDDYPMVASAHAKKRSEIALRIGLGKGGRGSRPANLPSTSRPPARPKPRRAKR